MARGNMTLVFEEFTLDLDRRLLLEGDSLVHLYPKALDLLALLIRHRPKALSRRRSSKNSGPETFVSENAIATLIADIRTAIKDDARRPRFIRTVHALYAFCGAATGDEAAAQSSTAVRENSSSNVVAHLGRSWNPPVVRRKHPGPVGGRCRRARVDCTPSRGIMRVWSLRRTESPSKTWAARTAPGSEMTRSPRRCP